MTQNLGTTRGDLIPSGDLKIAGGGTNPLVVSNYMSLGSFSGADIKVVVHYPRDRELERIAERYKQEQEAELAVAEAQFWATRDQLGASEFADAIQNLQALRQQVDAADEDIEKIKHFPTSKTLGEIQTISWGVFRDKSPVRTLGSVYPRAFTRGPRTIAGSMIFTVFYEHALHEMMQLNLRYYNTGSSDYDKYLYTTMLSDQLPPIDISLIFANEYGAISHMGIWGVEFFQEGGTFSIEDIYSENTIQYVARDFDPMRAVSTREIEGRGIGREWTETASDMLRGEQLLGTSGHLFRRNPYI